MNIIEESCNIPKDLYEKFRVKNATKTNLIQYIPVEGIEVKLLDACNRACAFCVNEDYFGKSINPFDTNLFIKSLFDWLDDPNEQEKPSIIYLTGGEPLLSIQSMKEIVCPVSLRNIVTRLVTNGTLLDDERIAELVDMGLTGIKVSYTSSDSNRLSRLVKGSQHGDPEKIRKGIYQAKKAGLWTFVRIGIGRHNCDEVVNIYKMMRDIDVDVIQFKPWVASGLAAINGDEHLLSENQCYLQKYNS